MGPDQIRHAAAEARIVFAGCGRQAHDAIEYMEQLLLVELQRKPPPAMTAMAMAVLQALRGPHQVCVMKGRSVGLSYAVYLASPPVSATDLARYVRRDSAHHRA